MMEMMRGIERMLRRILDNQERYHGAEAGLPGHLQYTGRPQHQLQQAFIGPRVQEAGPQYSPWEDYSRFTIVRFPGRAERRARRGAGGGGREGKGK
jgi:hypothetical protein